MRLERGDKISIMKNTEEMSAEVSDFFLGTDRALMTLKDIVDHKTRRTAQEVAMEWMGRLGVGVVIVRSSTAKYHRCECSVCGKKLPVTDGTVRDMTPEQRAHYEVIRYKDLTRPLGDHLRHVHPACLDGLAGVYKRDFWPTGLIHVGPPTPGLAVQRQSRATAALKAGGVPNIEAHRATMWIGGKEPECISTLLDEEKPIMLGDRVVTNDGRTGISLEESTGRLVSGTLKVSFDGTVKSVPRHLVRKT